MNSKTIIKIAFIIMLFLAFSAPKTQSLPPIYQDTIIVDINGNGDYTNIHEAIENSDPLTHIKIKPGLYHEDSFKINKKIALTGENSENTIIDFDSSKGITVNNSYIEIHDLQIIDTIQYSLTILTEMDNCNLSNLIISPKEGHGIVLRSIESNIYNCQITSDKLSGQGIKVRGDKNTINYCSVQGFGEGIMFLINSNDNKLTNCNTYGNSVGVDIRINSVKNEIKNCNIYGNEYGIYIWQNSNQNKVYQNNFWKNDIDAVDENNNDWYVDNEGNFWDDYTGKDSDDDGIGDTPYTSSKGALDRYPLIEMVLPNKITIPTGIELLSNSWDNTPMFSWSESLYKKGIKGYYVKIDDSDRKFVENTVFAVETPLSDGAHTFYVKAEGKDGTKSNYNSFSFSIDTTFIDSDGDGWSDIEEIEYGTDSENKDNYPLDTDNDHLPDSLDTDDDNDGYSDLMEQSYNTNTKNPDVYPEDTDNDGVPNNDSPDGKYTGDLDDDDDYLIDTVETKIGSNPNDGKDVHKIYIKGKPFYLVDTTQNNQYNILYHPETGFTTGVKKQGEKYLIDKNGDNKYEYFYNSLENTVATYNSGVTLIDVNTLIIINIILFSVAIILIGYYLKKRKNKYKKSKPTREKLIPISQPNEEVANKETIQMFGLTKNLLQNMQKEISVYMEQLNKIEKQISEEKTEEIQPETVMKEKTKEDYIIKEPFELESRVDRLIEIKEKDIKTTKNIEEKVDELLKNKEI